MCILDLCITYSELLTTYHKQIMQRNQISLTLESHHHTRCTSHSTTTVPIYVAVPIIPQTISFCKTNTRMCPEALLCLDVVVIINLCEVFQIHNKRCCKW